MNDSNIRKGFYIKERSKDEIERDLLNSTNNELKDYKWAVIEVKNYEIEDEQHFISLENAREYLKEVVLRNLKYIKEVD